MSKSSENKILIAFILNLMFSIFEFIGGMITGSIAIASDSVHDFGDACSIGISYFLEKMSKRKPNNRYTYGYIRYSLLGSIITISILLVGSIFVIYQSINRIMHPAPIDYNGMIIFAVFGVFINLIAGYVTKDGESLNQKSVNLHMLEDVLGWIVVLIGSILIRFTNIDIIDPILSIGVACFIMYHVFRNLRTLNDLFLEKTPNGINIEDIKNHLLEIKGVKNIHHIHIRSIDGYHTFATLHVVVDKYSASIKKNIKEELEEHGISHSTIELELEDENCEDINCDIKPEKGHHHHHH